MNKLPGYWKLNPVQKEILKTAIAGREVWDMGAGNGSLTAQCLGLGAAKAFAVEYQIPTIRETNPNIIWVNSLFGELPIEPRDTVLISWPWEKTNGADRLIPLAQNAKRVIVLAQTHGGTQCGTPDLWNFLATRKVVAYATDPANDLIVYENHHVGRTPLPTEAAGMDMETIHTHQHRPVINKLEEESNYLKFRGKCKEMSEAACTEDPTLTLVRGHYFCPIWNREMAHWWTVRADGTIHDPTKLQFPSAGLGTYTPFNGMVTCSECEKEVKEVDARFEGNYGFCSLQCNMRFVGL